MARSNPGFEKRQREQKKRQKQADKARKKAERASGESPAADDVVVDRMDLIRDDDGDDGAETPSDDGAANEPAPGSDPRST